MRRSARIWKIAVWDEDVTANRIVHDFIWRHGPIPWSSSTAIRHGCRGSMPDR
jgi:hypothetical protein